MTNFSANSGVMPAPNFGFDGPSSDEERQARLVEVLAHIRPDDEHAVRAVARSLKRGPEGYRKAYLEWAKPYGRIKAEREWDRARHDPDTLQALLDDLAAAAAKKQPFVVLSAAAVQIRPPLRWRIKSVLPAEGVAAIYGPSGSGKSFLSLAFAAAIAEGSPVFDHATKRADVLYIGLEGEDGYRGRVEAWQRHNGRAMPDGLGFLLQPFRLTDAQSVTDLAAMCPKGCVVFIDTLNRAAPDIDENSGKDMGAVIEGAKMLQRLTGGLVVLVAHTGKDGAKGLRGHSSLFAALDAGILVERDNEVRTWKTDKARDGVDGDEHRFRLSVIEIGEDEDDEAITSCIAVPDNSLPTIQIKPLPRSQQRGMDAFWQAAKDHGQRDMSGKLIGVHTDHWREAFYRTMPADSQDARKKAFQRVRNDLANARRISVEGELNKVCETFTNPAAVGNETTAEGLFSGGGTYGTKPGHVPVQ
ncbi:AAA family ATPase [Pseudochelatococcus lubricantis]|uniref:AAA family ATPase n=1 Tax=Pseudochelatococcus lubricantis TaxID=1538102 RepID=UPI0035E62039